MASVRFSADYRRFWSAAALSNLGDGARFAALPLLALTLTDDPVAIGLVVAILRVPWVVIGPLGGVFVDRVDRRRLMVEAQLAQGVIVGGLAVWLVAGEPLLLALYAIAFVLGTGEVLVDTASQAAVPQLAPAGPDGLERANGRLVAAQTLLDSVVGMPMGAALFAVAVALPFAVDAVSFVLSAVLLLAVRTPLQAERSSEPSTVRADLREGFVALWRSRLLREMAISVGLINVTLSASLAMFVIFVIDELGGSGTSYGVLLAIGAVGGFLGALVAARFVRGVGRRLTIVVATAVVGISTGAMAFASSAAVLAVFFFVAALAVTVANVTGSSIRQAVVPSELLGRVVASFRLIGMLGVPLGALAGGVIGAAAGVRAVYLVAGIFSILPLLAILSATRHLEEPATGEPVDAGDPA